VQGQIRPQGDPLRFCFLEIAAKETTYPKTTGNFKKQNFDSAGFSHCNLRYNIIPRLLRSEVTKSAQCFWFKCSFAMPTSKTASRFWNRGGKCRAGSLPTSACHPEHARNTVFVATYCSHLRARRSFAEKERRLRRSEQNRRRRDLLRV